MLFNIQYACRKKTESGTKVQDHQRSGDGGRKSINPEFCGCQVLLERFVVCGLAAKLQNHQNLLSPQLVVTVDTLQVCMHPTDILETSIIRTAVHLQCPELTMCEYSSLLGISSETTETIRQPSSPALTCADWSQNVYLKRNWIFVSQCTKPDELLSV